MAAIVTAMIGKARSAESLRLDIKSAMTKKTKRQAQPMAIGFISCKTCRIAHDRQARASMRLSADYKLMTSSVIVPF